MVGPYHAIALRWIVANSLWPRGRRVAPSRVANFIASTGITAVRILWILTSVIVQIGWRHVFVIMSCVT